VVKILYIINIVFIVFLSAIKSYSDDKFKYTKYSKGSIEERCEKALDFYLERPELETEFLRRLEYCINTVKDLSPEGFKTNPILSDFASMFGVNGRTRMQIHQGVDIIGYANETIIAVSDGIVLETALAPCVGPTVVIDHGKTKDNKKLIVIYSHTGDYLVKEGDEVTRGLPIAKLPEKIEHPCMARVRHLHLQIGQQYCEKEEKNTWGCTFFIKDLYSSLNPNDFWLDKNGKIRCYDKNKKFDNDTLTFPFKCKKQ
jgi:murein DD-endopeptidase MepM/ murein hydrolase activator NlpD